MCAAVPSLQSQRLIDFQRFGSIMILSVLRNTNSNSTVKFWFLDREILVPSFLVRIPAFGPAFCSKYLQEFIPHLAEAYKFQYNLVTYKWQGPEGETESFQGYPSWVISATLC
ncbi:hypothetical protein B0H13DRAFT_1886904 [Mycena leptocephala]|nr:hypothetical protein B0H13DRAFT_1886904 [Mycena leptocephala]